MARVGKTEAPGESRDIELFAAKGEYEPFQVVVRAPEGGLKNVRLEVSDLVGENGAVIASEKLALYREHYVLIQTGTSMYGREGDANQPQGPGWYPDALIPFVDPVTGEAPTEARFKASPFDIAAGENQPYWIDVVAPRDAAVGRYVGSYTVACDEGSASGQIVLNVWNFALPEKPSEGSMFVVWSELNMPMLEELLRHRIMPCALRPEQAEYQADHAQHLMDSYGLNMANAGFFSGADMQTYKMSPSPSAEEFQSIADKFPRGLRLVNYTADEIVDAPELNEPMRGWARNMHRAGIENLFVAPPVPELFDDGTGRPVVDIWVLISTWCEKFPELVDEARKRGMEIWTYTACNQDGYSPKWLLDFQPVNYRVLQGFLNQSMGFTGILFWAVDYWKTGAPRGDSWKDPWTDIHSECDGMNFEGEGLLVYPGGDAGVVGVVPSMRLKWVRKGMEDYEYIDLLKVAGQEDLALELTRSVAKDFRTWSQSPADYEKARQEMAAMLSLSGER